MGGLNLEVFKFGVYIMFPIGFMYYFGTNLDNRFAVPDFWPRPENSHRLPETRPELQMEVARIVEQQRMVKALRESRGEGEVRAEGGGGQGQGEGDHQGEPHQGEAPRGRLSGGDDAGVKRGGWRFW